MAYRPGVRDGMKPTGCEQGLAILCLKSHLYFDTNINWMQGMQAGDICRSYVLPSNTDNEGAHVVGFARQRGIHDLYIPWSELMIRAKNLKSKL